MRQILIGVLAVLVIVLAGPAFAQEAPGGTIDLTPLLNQIVLAVAAAVGAGLLYLVKLAKDWFKAKTGVDLQISDEMVRTYLDKIIEKGIALVVGAVGDKAKIKVGNEQLAQIANYVIAAAPDALAKFGITPERLQDMIRARLNAWTEGPAGSVVPQPTVPSAPAVATPAA